MSQSNVDVIRGMYDAFAKGDIEAVLGAMSPDIEWHEAENFPYADKSPYRGPRAVAEGVFARCGGEWEGFGVDVEELLDAGDTVVALGRYVGTYRATGRAQNPQVVHVWQLEGGKVVRFRQRVDTLHVARVIGSV